MSLDDRRITWAAGRWEIARSVEELDAALDKITAENRSEDPIIVIVDGPGGHGVYLGIGGDLSFVSNCELPYLTTLGKDDAEGQADYYFQDHHSPVARRHLISTETARRILREFFASGQLPAWQAWEPLGPDS
jgi:hypothetical protein